MTPMEMLEQMLKALAERQKKVEEAEHWYEGEHPIPDPPPGTLASTSGQARVAFDRMQRLAVTNFLPPIADVPASKLRIEGFRSSASATGTDASLWDIYRRNRLVADGSLAIDEALRVGQTAAIVWRGPDGLAEITMEDPEQVIVRYAPGSRYRREMALKAWDDEDGYRYATLFTVDSVYKFKSKVPASKLAERNVKFSDQWGARSVPGEPWPVTHQLGEVPMVEIRVNAGSKARRYGGGHPQFHGQINDQRRINRTVFSRLLTEDAQAFRQRWATDWDYPVLEDGVSPDIAQMREWGASNFMVLNSSDDPEAKQVKVGEFSQADFTLFLRVVQEEVKHIAAVTGTPPYAFLLGDMINVASDALARIEGTHLANVRNLADELDPAFVDIMRLALKVEGDPRAADPSLAVVWSEFEQRTAAEQIELAKGAKELGAPLEEVFAMLPGVSQSEAARWADQARAQQLTDAAALAVVGAPTA